MTLLWRGELRRAASALSSATTHTTPSSTIDTRSFMATIRAWPVSPMGATCSQCLAISSSTGAARGHGTARRRAHPFSVVQALIYCAFIHHTRREPQQALELAKESATMSEQQVSFWLAEARMMEGWAQCEQGAACAGLAQLQQGFTEFLDTGALMDRPRWLSVLAEAHARCNQPDAGLRALTQGSSSWTKPASASIKRDCSGCKVIFCSCVAGSMRRDAETAYLIA